MDSMFFKKAWYSWLNFLYGQPIEYELLKWKKVKEGIFTKQSFKRPRGQRICALASHVAYYPPKGGYRKD